jgi:uroporphyrinogen-III synthase
MVENWHQLKLSPALGAPVPKVVSIGPVTSAKLHQLGYENIVEASVQTLESVVEAICRPNIE